MIYSKTVLFKNCAYVRRNLDLKPGFNADFYFNYDIDECKAIFTCSDEVPDPRLRKTGEDLELYIIKKFGAALDKENLPLPNNFDMSMKKIATITTNPLLKTLGKQSDSYQDTYNFDITDKQISDVNKSLLQLSYCEGMKFLRDKRIPKDDIKPTMGVWHG